MNDTVPRQGRLSDQPWGGERHRETEPRDKGARQGKRVTDGLKSALPWGLSLDVSASTARSTSC